MRVEGAAKESAGGASEAPHGRVEQQHACHVTSSAAWGLAGHGASLGMGRGCCSGLAAAYQWSATREGTRAAQRAKGTVSEGQAKGMVSDGQAKGVVSEGYRARRKGARAFILSTAAVQAMP